MVPAPLFSCMEVGLCLQVGVVLRGHVRIVIAHGVGQLVAVLSIHVREVAQVADVVLLGSLAGLPFGELLLAVLHHLVVRLGPLLGSQCLLLRGHIIHEVR